jgi:uncharacterized protein
MVKAVKEMTAVVHSLQQGLGDCLVAVVLFGSRARGEASRDSDWDLLVVAHDLPDKYLQRHLQFKQLLPIDWRGQVAILAKTPVEFEAHLSSLFLDIALDGIILYDQQGYISSKLSYLRQMIQQQGLRREQQGRDFVWRWQKFPGYDWSLEWEAT